METENLAANNPGRTAQEACADVKCCIENIRNVIADTLHGTAETLARKAAELEGQPKVSHYAGQASEWLEKSAECVRTFDYAATDAKFRDYVRQSPGRSILMAGAAGLIIGVILRRSR
ncbi:hypothetical protein [Geobacter sp. SVR]|uniref:hypothetical protein n=1 Tax=Geobacter sp. SVR TaxID=2495594 RepID=UPI00143F0293|nr:hypothetical protein [Geobacter sp. SVR]BCS54822.1 hypothetical protein GSVR_31300 [Geobacter sp. SVR]GCF86370.1 hypothetical protein GSbR_29700 [Geobacter sp. SVR]